jgi:heme/copper-type cytochrome/quinol oxidase subunit 3
MFILYCKDLKGRNIVPHSSFYPILTSAAIFGLALSFVGYLHYIKFCLGLMGLFLVLLAIPVIQWWSDLFIEFSTFDLVINVKGIYIKPANVRLYIRDFIKGTKIAMCLSILSEVMFSFPFLRAFLHSLGSPAIQIGCVWPPYGLQNIMPDPLLIPLANTLILLTSGITVTWAHAAILPKAFGMGLIPSSISNFLVSLIFTTLLACNFIGWQAYEFVMNTLQMSDGIYGSTFYILTGFHGLHVIIGTIFLFVFLAQGFLVINSSSRKGLSNLLLSSLVSTKKVAVNLFIFYVPSVGFECAVWYWHFVDVVWLSSFTSVYLPDSF